MLDVCDRISASACALGDAAASRSEHVQPLPQGVPGTSTTGANGRRGAPWGHDRTAARRRSTRLRAGRTATTRPSKKSERVGNSRARSASRSKNARCNVARHGTVETAIGAGIEIPFLLRAAPRRGDRRLQHGLVEIEASEAAGRGARDCKGRHVVSYGAHIRQGSEGPDTRRSSSSSSPSARLQGATQAASCPLKDLEFRTAPARTRMNFEKTIREAESDLAGRSSPTERLPPCDAGTRFSDA